MFAYPPAEPGRNEAYYPQLASEAALARLGLSAREREQMDRLGLVLGRAEKPAGGGGQEADERLGQALQQLVEDGRRRDQEAAYLTNLLRAWNELGQPEAYPAEVTEADLRNGYLDYDELAPMRAGAGNSRKLPELARYGNRDLVYNMPARPDLEEPLDGGKEVEEQVMRYLMGRILANMDANGDYARPPRLVKRELLSLAETLPSGQAKYAAGARRARRALDEGVAGQANLLRVKRLGGGTVDEEGEEEEDKFPAQSPKEAQLAGGLQRMKRIDGQFQDAGTPVRSRRYAGY